MGTFPPEKIAETLSAQGFGYFRRSKFGLKNIVVAIMETDEAGMETLRTKWASDIGDVSANTVIALRDASAAISARTGQSVA